MVGPTLLDLQIVTDSTIEDVTFTLIGRTVGMLIGPFLFAATDLKINIWLAFIICWIIQVITNATLPWSSYLPLMGVNFFFQGFAFTFYDTGKVYY